MSTSGTTTSPGSSPWSPAAPPASAPPIVGTARLRGGAVAVLDLDPDGAPDGVSASRADVTDDASVRRRGRAVAPALGGIDIVVNNAGIGAQGTVADNADDEWHRVFDVNVLGMVRVTPGRAAPPPALACAAVVNTWSIAATAGLPQRALYSATKGAVLALTRAMAADHLREGIRVNCVNPGTADTPWVGRLLGRPHDPAAERAALGRAPAARPARHGRGGGGRGGLPRQSPHPDRPRERASGRRRHARPVACGPGPEEARHGGGGTAHRAQARARATTTTGCTGEIPEDVAQALSEHGVHDWRIWRDGRDVFHVVEVEDYAAMRAALRDLPANLRWQAAVGPALRRAGRLLRVRIRWRTSLWSLSQQLDR